MNPSSDRAAGARFDQPGALGDPGRAPSRRGAGSAPRRRPDWAPAAWPVAPRAAPGSDAGLPVHSARHLGSFGVARAVGLVLAAWRPERIAGLLPLATALVVCLVGTSIVNVTTGDASPGGELSHAVEVIGLLGLWLQTRSPASGRARLSPA